MATEKQKRAVESLVGNGGNITQAMLAAGYSPNTANTPQKLTESDGFKELCDNVGLTDDFILKALKEDIDLKPQNRVQELNLASKMKGLITEKREDKLKIESSLNQDEINRLAEIFGGCSK